MADYPTVQRCADVFAAIKTGALQIDAAQRWAFENVENAQLGIEKRTQIGTAVVCF